MIEYREADDNFEAIKQKYGNMTNEEVEKVLKAEEERMKKVKESENKEQK